MQYFLFSRIKLIIQVINYNKYKIFLQAIVCCIIGLHWHSENFGDLPTRFISTGTAGGYLIILVGLFAGGLMGTPVNRRVVRNND